MDELDIYNSKNLRIVDNIHVALTANIHIFQTFQKGNNASKQYSLC